MYVRLMDLESMFNDGFNDGFRMSSNEMKLGSILIDGDMLFCGGKSSQIH